MFWWIFWVVVVLSLVFWAWPTETKIKRRDSALDELRRAYASGKFTEDEYRQRRAVLTEAQVPAKHTHSAA